MLYDGIDQHMRCLHNIKALDDLAFNLHLRFEARKAARPHVISLATEFGEVTGRMQLVEGAEIGQPVPTIGVWRVDGPLEFRDRHGGSPPNQRRL